MARTFLIKVPLPNASGNVQNLLTTPRLTNDNTQATARLDHRQGQRDTFYARLTFSNYSTFRPLGSTDLNETLVPGFGTRITTFTRNAVVNHTHVFTPALVNDLPSRGPSTRTMPRSCAAS